MGEPPKLGETASKGDKWLQGQTYAPDDLIKEFILERLVAIKTIGGYKSKGFGRIEVTASP